MRSVAARSSTCVENVTHEPKERALSLRPERPSRRYCMAERIRSGARVRFRGKPALEEVARAGASSIRSTRESCRGFSRAVRPRLNTYLPRVHRRESGADKSTLERKDP